MSLYDYEESKRVAAGDVPFYALIMAAMRRADSFNLHILQAAFPDVWDEVQARYNAQGGRLESDQ